VGAPVADRAEILAVGSELLTPGRVETNGAYLTARFLEAGIAVGARVTVADDPALLESAFRTALGRASIVIATGGLGPTEDDLTREAAARAAGRGLRRDPAILEALKARFARYQRVMAPVNEKQADVIEGAVVLPNDRGTAPGQRVDLGAGALFLLPGPPSEMQPMFDEQVFPWLRARAGTRVIRSRVFKIAGMSESDVEELVAPIYKTFDNPRTTILSNPGLVELHFVAEGTEAEAGALIDSLAGPVRAKLGRAVFSEDGRGLPEVVADLLRAKGLTLALAESCTGGLVASRLTAMPGASAFLERAFVTYSNRSKVEELGVPGELIERHGAVSAEVAREMARGARRAAKADIGAAVTGIAGPDGGTAEKPVGTVYLAVDGAAGDVVERRMYGTSRERVRNQACQGILDMIRKGLNA
jgi:nicotinamide-nucleotide amidase